MGADKEQRNAAVLLTALFVLFKHETEFLTLRIICNRTRSVLMFKTLVLW